MGLFERLFGPPSRDKFARLMIDAIKRAGEPADVQYDANEFRLVRVGEQTNQLNLTNAYHEFRQGSQQDRDRLVRAFVSASFAPLRGIPDEFEDARCDLFPIVRDRGYFELNALRLQVEQGESPDWPYQPLGEHFAIGVSYDLPESIVQVMQHHLEEWDVSLYEALEAARQNLEEITRVAQFSCPTDGLYVSHFDDVYDCSRLLLPELFDQLELAGRPVAMAPNRSLLLISGADDVPGLTAMVEAAGQSLVEQSRPQVGIALQLVNGDWEPFLPPEGHPARPRFRQLSLQSMGEMYAEQKQLLERLYEQQDRNLFVASFSGLEQQGSSELTSYCVWPEDVETILPETDVVIFAREAEDENDSVIVDWADVNTRFDRLFELADDLYPPRYRTLGFPDDALLARFGRQL